MNIENFDYQGMTDIIINALEKVIHNGVLGEQLAIEATTLAQQQSQYISLSSRYALATLRNFTSYIEIDDAFHTSSPTAIPTSEPTTSTPSYVPTVTATTDPNAAAIASLSSAGSSSYWALILLILVCFLVPLCIYCLRKKKTKVDEHVHEDTPAHHDGVRV